MIICNPRLWVCFTGRLFNSNNFAGSAALAQVCAPLSAVLVYQLVRKVCNNCINSIRRNTKAQIARRHLSTLNVSRKIFGGVGGTLTRRHTHPSRSLEVIVIGFTRFTVRGSSHVFSIVTCSLNILPVVSHANVYFSESPSGERLLNGITDYTWAHKLQVIHPQSRMDVCKYFLVESFIARILTCM